MSYVPTGLSFTDNLVKQILNKIYSGSTNFTFFPWNEEAIKVIIKLKAHGIEMNEH